MTTHLPELLRGILATHSLQDFSTAWVLVYEAAHAINIIVDNDVQSLVHGVVLADILCSEFLRHRDRGSARFVVLLRGHTAPLAQWL